MVDKTREGTTFGRYVLLEKIGVGGMAEILRAKTFGAAGFEKEFAIKLILPTLINDDEFVDMFINEAKIAVSLYHANIVQVFDLGQIEGQYYIAMEYVHGKDLLDVLARCADREIKLPLHIVLFATMEMLKGLDFAHRAKNPYGEELNIVHRDVSPSNILISYAGDVKVGDFGVAKAAVRRTLTESGTLKGKVGYMSPEQVMGEAIDSRSDVFSAGIVFFEALSMKRLFTGSSDLNIMLRIRDTNIDEHLERIGPLPKELKDIIRRALAKHREERYQSAGEFYQALVDFCFHYGIKITGADLSNFMRRLFAKEIEEEKARRMSESQNPLFDSAGLSLGAASSQVLAPARRRQIVPVAPSPLVFPAEPALALEHEPSSPSNIVPARFRVRTEDGAIFGPMTVNSARSFILHHAVDGVDLKVNQEQDEDERWLEIDQIDALADLVEVIQASAAQLHDTELAVEPSLAEQAKPEPEEPGTELDPFNSVATQGSSPHLASAPSIAIPSDRSDVREVVDELKQNYASYSGSFEQMSIARLLARLQRTKGTGRLNVRSGDVDKSIYFQQGHIILVDSNREDELLGTFLIRRKIITQAQLEQGFARLSEWGGRLGDALVATGAVPAHDIFRHLSEQMREKVLEIFTWSGGTFGYFENQEPETHGYPLDVDCYSTIAAGCRERVSLPWLLGFYKERMNVAILVRRSSPVTFDQLRLRGTELRVAKSIESGLNFRELVGRFTPAQRELVYRTIYLLHQVEMITFEQTIEDFSFPGNL